MQSGPSNSGKITKILEELLYEFYISYLKYQFCAAADLKVKK